MLGNKRSGIDCTHTVTHCVIIEKKPQFFRIERYLILRKPYLNNTSKDFQDNKEADQMEWKIMCVIPKQEYLGFVETPKN